MKKYKLIKSFAQLLAMIILPGLEFSYQLFINLYFFMVMISYILQCFCKIIVFNNFLTLKRYVNKKSIEPLFLLLKVSSPQAYQV